jgi:hypothetical protein
MIDYAEYDSADCADKESTDCADKESADYADYADLELKAYVAAHQSRACAQVRALVPDLVKIQTGSESA